MPRHKKRPDYERYEYTELTLLDRVLQAIIGWTCLILICSMTLWVWTCGH